eukprot:359285-Chlamydomonas_euryale.AAC.5
MKAASHSPAPPHSQSRDQVLSRLLSSPLLNPPPHTHAHTLNSATTVFATSGVSSTTESVVHIMAWPHLFDRHLVQVPLGRLDEALAVFGAAIRKQHTRSRSAIVRVDHLEHVSTGLAERVDGILHRHGWRILQEVAQQAVHYGQVQNGLLQRRRQRLIVQSRRIGGWSSLGHPSFGCFCPVTHHQRHAFGGTPRAARRAAPH